MVTLADGNRKTLVPGGTSPHYLATSNGAGHLIYTNKGTLFAIPFDPERLETQGTAVPILDDVAYTRRSAPLSLMSPEMARWSTAGAARQRPG